MYTVEAVLSGRYVQGEWIPEKYVSSEEKTKTSAKKKAKCYKAKGYTNIVVFTEEKVIARY